MKHSIRAFSVGLFTSGIILLIIFFFFDDTNKNQADQSEEEMITALEDNGYHVVTDSEYVSLSVQKDENRDAEKDDKGNEDESEKDGNNDEDKSKNEDNNADDSNNDENQNDDDEDETEKPNTYSLTIEEGMASSDIGAELEDNDIIDDAGKFNRFLEEEGYELKVQIGSYDVSDDMSLDEIAKAITK